MFWIGMHCFIEENTFSYLYSISNIPRRLPLVNFMSALKLAAAVTEVFGTIKTTRGNGKLLRPRILVTLFIVTEFCRSIFSFDLVVRCSALEHSRVPGLSSQRSWSFALFVGLRISITSRHLLQYLQTGTVIWHQ